MRFVFEYSVGEREGGILVPCFLSEVSNSMGPFLASQTRHPDNRTLYGSPLHKSGEELSLLRATPSPPKKLHVVPKHPGWLFTYSQAPFSMDTDTHWLHTRPTPSFGGLILVMNAALGACQLCRQSRSKWRCWLLAKPATGCSWARWGG